MERIPGFGGSSHIWQRGMLWLAIIMLLTFLRTISFPQMASYRQVDTPDLGFTFVPSYGSSDNLNGRIYNADPRAHKVAVYIFVEGAGWWIKPTFAKPLTPIQNDSSWTCNIATGGSDIYATKIHAFLLTNDINPPLANGLACLPSSLDTFSVADLRIERNRTAIAFSGYEWWVKSSIGPVGPGPNYFSDSMENVWVDQRGQLHLRITNRNSIWYCAEVMLKSSLGYGRYVFRLVSPIGRINENAVLGLFTWDNDGCQEFHREIDIEFSRWGIVNDPNVQYVVQPWYQSGNRNRWFIPTSLSLSTHSFDWQPDEIAFLSANGIDSYLSADSILSSWSYRGQNLHQPGYENVRFNLWLNNGNPPTDNSEIEVIIAEFEYELPTSSIARPHGIITQYALSQNYPNPFNPSTTFRFELPKASRVIIKIYDVLGREVRTLVDREFEQGRFEETWNSRDDRQILIPGGIYFMRMQTREFACTRKIVLVR